MLDYYEQRQPEYEAIYSKPERQADLALLQRALSEVVRGRRVLELACGTGYWTRRMAASAYSIHATDASARLSQAALGSCSSSNVTAGVLDAFDLPPLPEYDCVVAGFFWSHVSRSRLQEFMLGLAQAFAPGTALVLFDNRYVEGSNTPIARTDGGGNTYQVRELADGSSYEVLKNFPGPGELEQSLNEICEGSSVQQFRYFWFANGRLRGM